MPVRYIVTPAALAASITCSSRTEPPGCATARTPVARVSATMYDALGPSVTVTGDRGSVTLPAVIADLPDGVVWLPGNSTGRGVLADVGVPGSPVTLKGADV